MKNLAGAAAILSLLIAGVASASQPASYAGQDARDIKALSPEETQGYLAGKGQGLAKAAELNHYPGPMHVLEMADKLRLTADQKTRTESVFKAMRAEAIRQGTALVEQERELDRQFAAGTITSEGLRAALLRIGALQAEVRRAHLQAHLEQKAILTKEQVARYDELRGYGSGKHEHGGHSHKH